MATPRLASREGRRDPRGFGISDRAEGVGGVDPGSSPGPHSWLDWRLPKSGDDLADRAESHEAAVAGSAPQKAHGNCVVAVLKEDGRTGVAGQ